MLQGNRGVVCGVVWCVYTGLCDAPSAVERWVVVSSASASRSRFQLQPPASSITGVKREQSLFCWYIASP